MTIFKAALGICGLSQTEAADFFPASLNSIKDWSAGRANPPPGIWRKLADLYDQIVQASEDALDTLEIGEVKRHTVNDLAKHLHGEGLPTQGAQMAASAMFFLSRIIDDDIPEGF